LAYRLARAAGRGPSGRHVPSYAESSAVGVSLDAVWT
jgi:hypothetical protein